MKSKNVIIILMSIFISFSNISCVMSMRPQKDVETDYTAKDYSGNVNCDSKIAVSPAMEQLLSANLKFEDVPLPAGFKIVIRDSFVFNNDFTRVGIVEYFGPGEISTITNFFKKQMPLFNWELVNSIEYYKSVITFEKEGQTCTIIVEQPVKSKILFTVASGPRK